MKHPDYFQHQKILLARSDMSLRWGLLQNAAWLLGHYGFKPLSHPFKRFDFSRWFLEAPPDSAIPPEHLPYLGLLADYTITWLHDRMALALVRKKPALLYLYMFDSENRERELWHFKRIKNAYDQYRTNLLANIRKQGVDRETRQIAFHVADITGWDSAPI